MKKTIFLIFLLLPYFIYAQESMSLGLGNASFFLDTKIMEDGSINNVGFGLNYSDNWSGEIRGQAEITSKNEEVEDVADSLIATKETVYEVYLLPIQYRSTINSFQWKAGAGVYYEYQKSAQKGFIDMPELETIGKARVNSYTDDFTMHLVGPLIDVSAHYNSEWLSIGFSGGVVPVFSLTATEEQRFFPLVADTINHTQNAWGTPYFYLGLDSVLLKYLSLAVNYNYARLEYEVIDFDDNLVPMFPQSTVVSQLLTFEASALIPLGKDMGFQVGYGYMLNFYTLNSGDPVKTNKHYIILSGKKSSF